MLFASLPSTPLILGEINNAAHAPVFAALAIVINLLLRGRVAIPPWARMCVAFGLAIGIGGLIEWIQPLVGREASLTDLRNDALGALAGVSLLTWRSTRVASCTSWRPLQVIAATVCLLSLAIALAPLAWATISYSNRIRQFPTILDPSTLVDDYFLAGTGVQLSRRHLPPPWRHDGDLPGLTLRILQGEWPGLTHLEPQPDWRGYSQLRVDLTNPGDQPITLTIRIHDRLHDNTPSDRFNYTFDLPAATRTVVDIPIEQLATAPNGRNLDLSRIAGLIIFTTESPETVGKEIHLTSAWLE